MHVCNYQKNIATINYYFIFDPATFKLSVERDYFLEVCRVGEGNERQLCVGDWDNNQSIEYW